MKNVKAFMFFAVLSTLSACAINQWVPRFRHHLWMEDKGIEIISTLAFFTEFLYVL